MNGDSKLYELLKQLQIDFEYIEHPAAPTIEVAQKYWGAHEVTHCKNLFFRNHKGNRHYLVILEGHCDMNIRRIEQQLKQGKLTFASPERLMKWLGLTPGSVSPFGLIHDTEQHVHLFIDQHLRDAERLSFHPCINTASLFVRQADFVRFLESTGNQYEWVSLY